MARLKMKKGKGVFIVRVSLGRPSKMSGKQKKKLVKLLLEGTRKHGFATELWTMQRIADLIGRKLDIMYHRDHIGILMHQMGWSYQKPERRALKRSNECIERWKKEEEWPRV